MGTLSELEYWILIVTIYFAHVMIGMFVVIHSHVWTKNGYAGTNKVLEAHEVDMFISHVLSECSILFLFIFSMLDPILQYRLHFVYSLETKIIFAATFLGAGIYTILGNRFKDPFNLKSHGKETSKGQTKAEAGEDRG